MPRKRKMQQGLASTATTSRGCNPMSTNDAHAAVTLPMGAEPFATLTNAHNVRRRMLDHLHTGSEISLRSQSQRQSNSSSNTGSASKVTAQGTRVSHMSVARRQPTTSTTTVPSREEASESRAANPNPTSLSRTRTRPSVHLISYSKTQNNISIKVWECFLFGIVVSLLIR